MKIKTRDGIFEVIDIENQYFLGSDTWKKFYVIQEENISCITLIPEELVLEELE